jgi:hypothetical protein
MKLTGDRNQCRGCALYFNSTYAFDKHRIGEHGVSRRCASLEQMHTKGMVLGNGGFWRGSVMAHEALARKVGVA